MKTNFTTQTTLKSFLTGSNPAYRQAAASTRCLTSTPTRSFVFRRSSQRSLKQSSQK
jgi:hypothetical protein